MKLKEALKAKVQSSENNDVGIESQLFKLADDIEKQCREHLKRVITVLKEFDLHDESHSLKVLQNIEALLGYDTIANLSCYDLFLLHLAPFLHDCAMAPAEWEINLFELTEGTEQFYILGSSCKNDLKQPFKYIEAMTFIKDACLYDDFNQLKQWFFSPKDENKLIEELAELLINYQSFRNGYKIKIEQLTTNEEFRLLNEAIRTEFIRQNHHLRVEKYIKNLAKDFEATLKQAAWGTQLARDLAIICRSHCEDISFIEQKLNTKSHYFGQETANPQMAAMLLRLGDIIHFSFDRAPIEIRAAKIFQSNYSFHQWAIKNNGVNYTIEAGLISFKAFCSDPKDYFKIQQYIDWIDIEIQNYFRFERNWKTKYLANLKEKVNRDGICHDEEIFHPVRDLKFRLNQKQILDLLMGVELYKDKYSCLRELYQNALDACRCIQSSVNHEIQNTITFGLNNDEEGSYLYCQDDGIGMTKTIIQDYLLNIGNSYYKSADFFKKQAQWQGNFTPTSQFGIGILSCFMIGSRLEITTKTPHSDVISCSIDGPHETFYYKTPNRLDIETIGNSGTIIKILLLPAIAEELNTKPLEKLDFLLLKPNLAIDKEFKQYEKYFIDWETHLYNKINQLISTPTNKIKVLVDIPTKEPIFIPNKPYYYSEYETIKDELSFVNHLAAVGYAKDIDIPYSNSINHIKTYKIVVAHLGIEATFLLALPKADFPYNDILSLQTLPQVGRFGCCIDGIKVDNTYQHESELYLINQLQDTILLNFTGDIRPQLSVDRKSITHWPENTTEIIRELISKATTSINKTIAEHITKFALQPNSNEINLIWSYIFEQFRFAAPYFIKAIYHSTLADNYWSEFNKITNRDITIKEFIKNNKLIINNPNAIYTNPVLEQVMLGKLTTAHTINVSNNQIEIITTGELPLVNLYDRYGSRDFELFFAASSWQTNTQFDLITNLLPIIPERLLKAIQQGEYHFLCDQKNNYMKLFAYSNGIGALFKQESTMINEVMGLYSCSKDIFDNDKHSKIYNFETKRSAFGLFEINSRESVFKAKKINMLFVFISPKNLSEKEQRELNQFSQKDPAYFKGVTEGWSILFTGRNIQNTIIKAGIQDRETLVDELNDEFWQEYKDYTFKFLDGTEIKSPKKANKLT